MNDVLQLLSEGGPIMAALIGLCLVLYYLCFKLLLEQTNTKFNKPALPGQEAEAESIGAEQIEAQRLEQFDCSMRPISCLIAAAPLLGLLGTVVGMINTFESLSSKAGGRSFEGLAQGISLALTTTETGLAIAIPALILTYFARRQMQKSLHRALIQEANR